MQDTDAGATGSANLRSIKLWVQVFLSVICLGAAFSLVSAGDLIATMTQADWSALTLVLLLVPIAVALRAWRWQVIIQRRGVAIPFVPVLKVTLIGQALNLFLPASLGDVARSYYAWREQGKKEIMLATAILDKVVALFTLCVLGLICAVVVKAYAVALVSFVLTLPLVLLLLFPDVIPWKWGCYLFRRLVKRELDGEELARTFRSDRSTLVVSIGISLLGWGVTNLIYYYAWSAFTPNIHLAYAFAVAPLINVMRILPITISGLGSADLLIVFLLGAVGINHSDALMGSLAVNVSLIMLPGMAGAFYLMFSGTQQR
jgi:uncharacterized membrane protein YbhN (UPF0104 family)